MALKTLLITLFFFFATGCGSPEDSKTRLSGGKGSGGDRTTPGKFDLPKTQKINTDDHNRAISLFEQINRSTQLVFQARRLLQSTPDPSEISTQAFSKELRLAIQGNCNHEALIRIAGRFKETISGRNCPLKFEYKSQILKANSKGATFYIKKGVSSQQNLIQNIALGYSSAHQLSYTGFSEFNQSNSNSYLFNIKYAGELNVGKTIEDRSKLNYKFIFLLNEKLSNKSNNIIINLALHNSIEKLLLRIELNQKTNKPMSQKIYLNGELISKQEPKDKIFLESFIDSAMASAKR